MANENKVRNTASTVRTTGISSASVNNGAGLLGSAIDFSAAGDRDLFLACQLTASHASAPSAGGPYYLYLLRAIDGTNYEDGGTSVQPQRPPDAMFQMRPVTGSQVVTQAGIMIRVAAPTKLLLWNASGQNATGVTLIAYSSGEAIGPSEAE